MRPKCFLVALSISLACGGATLFAEAIDPTLAAAEFVRALQQGDKEYVRRYADLEGISKQQGRGYTYTDLRKLFAHVDARRLKWSERTYDENRKVITIRSTQPASFEFKFQHGSEFYRDRLLSPSPCPDCIPPSVDFYLIIGVRPF